MPFDLKNWSLFAWVSFRGGFGCWLDWPMKIGVIFVVGFSPILVNLKQRDTLVNPKAWCDINFDERVEMVWGKSRIFVKFNFLGSGGYLQWKDQWALDFQLRNCIAAHIFSKLWSIPQSQSNVSISPSISIRLAFFRLERIFFFPTSFFKHKNTENKLALSFFKHKDTKIAPKWCCSTWNSKFEKW